MSGFPSLSTPLKPRSEVTVHPIHPTLEQKPRAKYSVPDWFNHKWVSDTPSNCYVSASRSYAISYDAERSRNVSHQVRQDGRRLINETYNESWWNKHDKSVDHHLSSTEGRTSPFQRCAHLRSIGRSRQMAEDTRIQHSRRRSRAPSDSICQRTMRTLFRTYAQSTRSVHPLLWSSNALRLDISLENYVTRNGRKAIDNVDDEAERELKKVSRQHCYSCCSSLDVGSVCHRWYQTTTSPTGADSLRSNCASNRSEATIDSSKAPFDLVLSSSLRPRSQDLQDKHTAHAICEENLQLNEFSPNLSYKPDPCRPLKGQITPEEWLAFSKYNKDRAEKESLWRNERELQGTFLCRFQCTNLFVFGKVSFIRWVNPRRTSNLKAKPANMLCESVCMSWNVRWEN